MIRVRVHISVRDSVHDPAGAAVCRSLAERGMDVVSGVRIGRLVELDIDADTPAQAHLAANQAAADLLANPVIEQWQVEVMEPAGAAT